MENIPEIDSVKAFGLLFVGSFLAAFMIYGIDYVITQFERSLGSASTGHTIGSL